MGGQVSRGAAAVRSVYSAARFDSKFNVEFGNQSTNARVGQHKSLQESEIGNVVPCGRGSGSSCSAKVPLVLCQEKLAHTRQSRPDVKQSRPAIRQSSPDIQQSRPDITQSRPEGMGALWAGK